MNKKLAKVALLLGFAGLFLGGPAVADMIGGSNVSSSGAWGGTVVATSASVTGPFNAVSVAASSVTVSSNTFLSGATFYQNGPVVLSRVVFSSSPFSNWISFTPTVTGVGTILSAQGWYRQVGDSMEVIGWFTNGTVAASNYTIAIPNGRFMDTTKLPTTTMLVGEQRLMIAAASAGATIQQFITLFYDGSTTGFIFGARSNGANAYTKMLGSDAMGSGDSVSFRFSVPISGWSF